MILDTFYQVKINNAMNKTNKIYVNRRFIFQVKRLN